MKVCVTSPNKVTKVRPSTRTEKIVLIFEQASNQLTPILNDILFDKNQTMQIGLALPEHISLKMTKGITHRIYSYAVEITVMHCIEHI